ncbi:MAG: dynamin family protein [Clostridia bacterium]|nr:dynamin family protein [Clostridia bacterium]
MSIEDRIVYSGNEIIQNLETFLDRMKIFTYDTKYSMLLGEGIIEKIKEWDKTIRRQKDLPLTLTVCGEFKRGKSSLINAILGEDVVTTNITTETITTNKISYGNHKNELILSGGRRIALSDEELHCDRLKTILAELPERAYEIELKRPIEILKQLTIIDTPGLGDSIADFLGDVRNALQQSDAVIYVFSALYPLSIQEQLFIKNVIKPQKYTEFLMVSNYCDSFEDEAGCERVVEVINDRLSNILPGETPFMISALDERCKQLSVARPNAELEEYLENNFDSLRKSLTELLEEKKEYVIPNRVHRLISAMTEEINMLLEALMQGLTLNHDEINQKALELAEYKKRQDEQQEGELSHIDAMIEKAKGDTTRWIDAMLTEMEQETKLLSNYSVQDVKNNYSMYCTETIQTAIDRCIDKFTADLYDLLDDISANVSKDFSMIGVTTTPSFRLALHNKSWTLGDKIAFFGSMGSPSWLTFITDYVSGSLRNREIKKSMPDVIFEIKGQFPGLRAATFTAIDDMYSTIQSNVKQLISDYFNEQITALENQVEQAAAISRQSEEKKQEIKAAVSELNSAIDDICADLSISVQLQEN